MNAPAAMQEQQQLLRRPLTPGGAVAYWQFGETAGQRYDVPDAPMQGEMDPFFFLTKEKNFIPHEYPCRTQFAAEHRDRRPNIPALPEPGRWWLPFGSPRLDLSGFWFRPTWIANRARTFIEAEHAGLAEFELATCGGALLFVNGEDAGWMAPYVRNLEQRQRFGASLKDGLNEIEIWFDDLAERDARFQIELAYISGPAAAVALPLPVTTTIAEEIERLLSGMRFSRPSYLQQPVALLHPSSVAFDLEARIEIAGEIISGDGGGQSISLPAGSDRIELGPSDRLPADFQHVTITLQAGGFSASRTLGVEVCHGNNDAPPADLSERIAEALDTVARGASPDTVRALACLSIGLGGVETDAMIAGALEAIEDCHDCADFALVPLLWARARFADAIDPTLLDRVDAAILGYRYWMDEPGNDVQWYFSENHALLFHTSAYLAGHIFPTAHFVRSGRLGKAQSQVGAARVRAWFDHFENWEMAEFNSAPYFPIDFKGLCALFALAPDTDIRERARASIHRLLEIVARSAHHGVLTAAQGRSYEHSLWPARTLELSAIARLCWGRGWFGRKVHALPLLVLALRDHGLDLPIGLDAIANHAGAGTVEWRFAQGQNRIAKLYHYKGRDFAMGSAAKYRWGQWGYQETLLHLRLGDNPQAQIWINHPGETIQFGSGRPSYWGGSGTVPRVHQYRSLAVLDFALHETQPDFTHAWFPIAEFDGHLVEGDTALATAGGGRVLLKGSGPLSLTTQGPSAGLELRLNGRRGRWIVRLSSEAECDDLDALGKKFGGLAVTEMDDASLVVKDPVYGHVGFGADGVVMAEGRRLDPSDWTIKGEVTDFPAAMAG